MQRIGLYYPYVHFRKEQWIKAAALYWPGLARVVPRGFPVRDPELVKALRDGLDNFLTDVDPREAAAAVAPSFLKAVEDHGTELRQRFLATADTRPFHSQQGNQPEPLMMGQRIINAEPTSPNDLRTLPRDERPLAGLYPHEVDPGLADALRGAGLAVPAVRSLIARSADVTWLAMDPGLAWIYKCVLTEELARRTRYAPITDQVAAHSAADGWDSDRIAAAMLGERPRPASSDETTRLGLMAVQCILPDGLRSVPVAKIIQLRNDYRAEFSAFTQAVDKAAADLREQVGGIEDRAAFELHLRMTFDESIAQPLEDLRKAMSGLNLKTFYSALNYKFEVPALAAAASGWAGNVPIAGGSLAIAVATLRQATAEARDAQLAGSPVSYLLRVERNLKPTTLVRRVARTLGRAAGSGI
ncbi:uncharacterized protein SGFS_019150 [Streptomyces graminofaciens]|uniref:Uncharacterized protein n=1 Tax=Streptomyces graminofaciens TaxID=68212 RepID=A0ABM7F449_9ACTN|nr:DUF6236 family protein [Streptomyces graminofaciens]BBC30621.1 uncharacterized protein SGFS_019150 [Streptomyces graminofaciens]